MLFCVAPQLSRLLSIRCTTSPLPGAGEVKTEGKLTILPEVFHDGLDGCIVCLAASEYKRVKFRWIKDGEPFPAANSSDVRQVDEPTTSRLTFDSLDVSHSGVYTCVLKSGHETTRQSIHINIKDEWKEILKPAIEKLLELARDVNNRRTKLQIVYDRWYECTAQMDTILERTKTRVKKHARNGNWTEAGGSSLALTGSIIAVVGIVLSVPTAGVSLALTIAGGSLSFAGGVVATGSSLAGGILRKRLKKKAKQEFSTFEKRSKKLQTRCTEYIDSLNEFFRSYSNRTLPACIRIAKREDSSLIPTLLLSEEQNASLSVVSTIQLLSALAERKENRSGELILLSELSDLIGGTCSFYESCAEFSATEFCPSAKAEVENSSFSLDKCVKQAKVATGTFRLGVATPALTARTITLSSDAVEALIKGGAFAGRAVSVAIGSFSLALDAVTLGIAVRKIYKGHASRNLEEVEKLIKDFNSVREKATEALRSIGIAHSCEPNKME